MISNLWPTMVLNLLCRYKIGKWSNVIFFFQTNYQIRLTDAEGHLFGPVFTDFPLYRFKAPLRQIKEKILSSQIRQFFFYQILALINSNVHLTKTYRFFASSSLNFFVSLFVGCFFFRKLFYF